jgi:hypothetical protein
MVRGQPDAIIAFPLVERERFGGPMSGRETHRIPIRFDRWYVMLSTAIGLSPASSYLEVSGDHMHVRMGWAFRATFPLRAVASTDTAKRAPLSRGVHGFAGRWLVNGSGDGIVAITLEPAQRAHMLGLPVRLQQLLVSVSEPRQLASLLKSPR